MGDPLTDPIGYFVAIVVTLIIIVVADLLEIISHLY